LDLVARFGRFDIGNGFGKTLLGKSISINFTANVLKGALGIKGIIGEAAQLTRDIGCDRAGFTQTTDFDLKGPDVRGSRTSRSSKVRDRLPGPIEARSQDHGPRSGLLGEDFGLYLRNGVPHCLYTLFDSVGRIVGELIGNEFRTFTNVFFLLFKSRLISRAEPFDVSLVILQNVVNGRQVCRCRHDVLHQGGMTVEHGGITLMMTDLGIVGRVGIEAAATGCVEGFSAALPRAVLDFFTARADPKAADEKGTLEFPEDGKTAIARHGRARMTQSIMIAADFPQMLPPAPDCAFEMPADEFCRYLRLCEPAFSTEETRYYLNGAFLTRRGDDLVFVGLDGHRVHSERADLPTGADRIGDHIIPTKAVKEICRVFGDSEGALKIELSKGSILVEQGSIRIASKLVDGTYPDFERVMPPATAFKMRVDATALDRAIASLMIIPQKTGDGKTSTSRAVRIAADGAEQIILQMKGNDGDIEDRLPAVIDHPEDAADIALNASYLRDVLSVVGPGDIALCRTDHANAIRLVTRNEAQDFLVMALRY
jgi:DNA polymerase III subunit beta